MEADRFAAGVNPQHLLAHLQALEGPRDPFENPDRLSAAQAYVVEQLRRCGLTVELDLFEHLGVAHANIVARRAGNSRPSLLIGAHLDTVPGTPGADDNASGVAATRRRNEDYRSRISIWSDTVAKWPRNPRAHANLGNALLEEGRIDEAIAHFQEALGGMKQGWVATGPGTPLLYHNLGVALARQQRLDEAIDAYRKVVELDPASVATHNNLGVALAQQGNLRDALEEFSQALRLDPADADAQANLKEAREQLGRSDAR